MTPAEELQEWFVTLSDMISGPIDESSELEEGIIWFGNLDTDTLEQLKSLGNQSSTVKRFLELGRSLLEQVQAGWNKEAN